MAALKGQNLRQIQERMAAALMLPLTRSGHIARRTTAIRDNPGRSMAAEAAAFIKPNSRLTSLERLDIYSRSYWFRLMDSIREDFPGLVATVGVTAFERLSKAYLVDCPSQSFTLRNLGSRLEDWLRRNPQYAGPALDLALDIVRLEWAHIEAFDSGAEKALGPEDLIEFGSDFRAGIQPHIRLLALKFPVDELRIHVNRASSAGGAENTVSQPTRRFIRQVTRLRPEHIFVAVHRFDSNVYYRRIALEEYSLLHALRQGQSIGEAVGTAFAHSPASLDQQCSMLSSWFAAWAELGWLCQPQREIKSQEVIK
jgi:hypothetical protein